jgi:hypothetical protein
MIVSLFATVALATLGLASPSAEPLEKRARAQVITSCTVAGTAALTFVSSALLLSPL